MSPQRQIVDQHLSRAGDKVQDTAFPRKKVHYDVYECDHCGRTFTNEMGTLRSYLDSTVMDHLEEEHPSELERDPYPNEEVFREWAEAIGRSVEEPRVPGEPLLVRHGEMQYVYLHDSGTITLEAHRHLGGDRDDETVRLEGEDRLAVRGREWRNGYISGDAFPVLRR